MKNRLSLLLLFVLVSTVNHAQAVYQIASIQSDQVKLVDKDFVYENEHLKVIYNFWEEGGRMRFLLYNKTDQPIYIDWSKSFIEYNGSISLYSQLSEKPGNVPADDVLYTYQNASVKPLPLTAQTNRVAQVPPHMYMAVADFLINYAQQYTHTAGKFYTYTKENTPLQVDHQLAYSLNDTLTDTRIIAHSFWAESIHAVKKDDVASFYGTRKYGQPNALYALRHTIYEPMPNYEAQRAWRTVGNVFLGILSVVVRVVGKYR